LRFACGIARPQRRATRRGPKHFKMRAP
jgi:hypothetical protein